WLRNLRDAPTWLQILLVVLVVVAFAGIGNGDGGTALLAVALLVAGVLLFRHDTRAQLAGGAGPAGPGGPGGPGGMQAAGPQAPARAPRPRSMLGRVTLAATLLAAGGAAVLDAAGLVRMDARAYLALAMTVVGLGLLAGAWIGRARWLIAVGLVLVPPLLVA